MEEIIDFAIKTREWLASYNFYIAAAISLTVTWRFIRTNERAQSRPPPTGIIIYVFAETIAFTSFLICLVRLLTGAFDSVLHWEESVCFLVGSAALAYVIFAKIKSAFRVANTHFKEGEEPLTSDY